MRRQTNMTPPKALAGYVWILTMAVISCSVFTQLPQPPATPTAVPPTATSTQTALPATPTPLPTFIVLPTSTAGSLSDQLSCKLLSQSMKNGRHFSPREDFEMGWLVRNDGSASWEPAAVDFAYFSGTKMYQFSPSHLQTIVEAGNEVALGASLMAPKNSGTYTTVWALRKGNYDFCHVSIRIIVP